MKKSWIVCFLEICCEPANRLCIVVCVCAIRGFSASVQAWEMQRLVAFNCASFWAVCVWLISPVSCLYEWRHVSGDDGRGEAEKWK